MSFVDKPPIEDLQYFLDFQIAQAWAPEQSTIQRKEPVCPSLQFSLMGPKLYISPDQVITWSQVPLIMCNGPSLKKLISLVYLLLHKLFSNVEMTPFLDHIFFQVASPEK